MYKICKTIIRSTLTTFIFAATVFASSTQSLRIVPNTQNAGLTHPDSVVRVEWIQLAGANSQTPSGNAPIDASLYVSRTPGGGDLSRYTRLTNRIQSGTTTAGSLDARYAQFVPGEQGNIMRPGVYYLIVAGTTDDGDTLYSDYLTVMVESQRAPTIIQPRGDLLTGQTFARINSPTPLFRWSAGDANVPYYHVLLFEGSIVDDGGNPVDNINVIWQAITQNTSISYGAPDPSGTITASPPPLTPGKRYSWMVLNNYGNHMAFTSNVFNAVDLMLGQFVINGDAGISPEIVAPIGGSFSYGANPTLEFSFTNLDQNANSFLVNLFYNAPGSNLGISGLGDLNAGILIWETTVSRGGLSQNDTIRINFDAAGTLTGGEYSWRVHAISSQGAASTGTESIGYFSYRARAGSVNITTREFIGGVPFPLGYTELGVEVIAGPTQAPLALYTDANGTISRDFPVGTYRITANKDGFSPQTATVNVSENATSSVSLAMSRPEATIYGRVLSQSDNSPLNLVRVTAISEWGDTIVTHTDGRGSFSINCRAATWNILVAHAGFQHVSQTRVTVRSGENREVGTIFMRRNPFTFSGTIRNGNREPITGARVRLFNREGALINELASTAQNGIYSFNVAAGSYTIAVERSGFVMFTRNIDITSSRVLDVTMHGGAAVVNGTVMGTSFVPDAAANGFYREVRAPVPSARVRIFEDESPDTFTVISDPVFGLFSVSLPARTTFNYRVDAAGFDAGGYIGTITTGDSGETRTFDAAIRALAMIRGNVTANGSPLANTDVLVYDANGTAVASGTTDAQGTYEVRSIPNGRFNVSAGRVGFYTATRYALNIVNGRPTTANGGAVNASYDFSMSAGNTAISWRVLGDYNGGGSVNILSPLNTSVPFVSNTARLENAGPGRYIFEADPGENHPELLMLSRREIDVGGGSSDNEITFTMKHDPVDTLRENSAGIYELEINQLMNPMSYITRISLFNRSEGSLRWNARDTVFADTILPTSIKIPFTPVRTGANINYYFEITMSNGDVYGSPKQLYTAFVMPNDGIITKFTLTPGDTGDDTLVFPSSYTAEFSATAFISDVFTEVNSLLFNYSWISCIVIDETGAAVGEVVRGNSNNRNKFTYTTPATAQDLTLRVTLDLSQTQNFEMKDGLSNTFDVPLRITGKAIASMAIRRQGDEAPITNTGVANFTLEALDEDGNPLTLTPNWSVVPDSAGEISPSGEFSPKSNFFGTARILATAGSRIPVEYTTALGATGIDVRYILRNRSSRDTVSAFDDQMRLVFLPNAIDASETAEFSVAIPDLRNLVHRGSAEFRMADSVAFDLVNSSPEQIAENTMFLMFPIPERLRGGGHDFRIARWSNEDLKWIPLATSELTDNGTAVIARLTNMSASPLLERATAQSREQMSADAASRIVGNARYALVTRSNRFAVSVSVSPHPFSPHIVPVLEHGANAQEGTRISVNVTAPETFVRSVQVHIYNATGQLVWAIIDQNATTGDNFYWWNGRTSGNGNSRSSVREEAWTENFPERTRNRPLVRNGRYFVTVIVTDMDNNKRRERRPVVVLK